MSYIPSFKLTTRASKGAPLTHAEMDANLLILDLQSRILGDVDGDFRYVISVADAIMSNRLAPMGDNAINFRQLEALIIPKGKFFTTDANHDYFYCVSVENTDYGTNYSVLYEMNWPLNTALPFDIVIVPAADMTVNFTVSDTKIGGSY